jgi:uncharacterized repeat protein (TIGR03803 family)
MAILTSVASLVLMFASSAFAGTLEKVIYNFSGSVDGSTPSAALIADRDGNLYGTTEEGGGSSACPSGCGTIFEINPPARPSGIGIETQLYIFQGGSDGSAPVGALVFDEMGNLYGTTSGSGSGNGGTVFELSPPATPGGAWSEAVLYTFPADGSRGLVPLSNLIFDSDGNLYGTTFLGGSTSCGCGTVFELSPPATPGGVWTETVLHEFGLTKNDGIQPVGGLVFDKSGTLYGTTSYGGLLVGGTIFQMKRHHGVWSMKTLYSVDAAYGLLYYPLTGVIIDSAGNLYGTLNSGGYALYLDKIFCSCGGVFELSPPATEGDAWTFNVLTAFSWGAIFKGGAFPRGVLVLDKAGNLYGTTYLGGLNSKNQGIIFELNPPIASGAGWTESTLHNFAGPSYGDGSNPTGLVLVSGKFYGTTSLGGSGNLGTVFSLVITP